MFADPVLDLVFQSLIGMQPPLRTPFAETLRPLRSGPLSQTSANPVHFSNPPQHICAIERVLTLISSLPSTSLFVVVGDHTLPAEVSRMSLGLQSPTRPMFLDWKMSQSLL